jgi:hypothetical protein
MDVGCSLERCHFAIKQAKLPAGIGADGGEGGGKGGGGEGGEHPLQVLALLKVAEFCL